MTKIIFLLKVQKFDQWQLIQKSPNFQCDEKPDIFKENYNTLQKYFGVFQNEETGRRKMSLVTCPILVHGKNSNY